MRRAAEAFLVSCVETGNGNDKPATKSYQRTICQADDQNLGRR